MVVIAQQTKVGKSHAVGITAETTYKMDQPDRYLQATTMKGNNGYPYTSFQSVTIKDNVLSYVIFQDFSKRTQPYREVKRCTEKSILECHNKSLESIESVLEEANKHYAGNEVEVEAD